MKLNFWDGYNFKNKDSKNKRYMKFYEPQIYPLGLCIAKTVDELNKYYETPEGKPLVKNPTAEATTYPMNRKGTEYGAVGIVLWKKPTIKTIAHEAYHAADIIFQHIGADYAVDGSNEHWAYLIGWVASCIEQYANRNF